MNKLNNYFKILDIYFYDGLFLDLYPEILNKYASIKGKIYTLVKTINYENSFEIIPEILLLDAQIQILYELSKDIETTNITETEIINISESDKDYYYLENFGLTRVDKIPFSILFLNHLSG